MAMRRRGFLRAAGLTPVLIAGGASVLQGEANRGALVFAHGVASGDPLVDRVILWTRVSPPKGRDAIEVDWEIAEDSEFRHVVASGQVGAFLARDFCVKVDATGLAPGRRYHYRFRALGEESMVGRTKTLPEGPLEHLSLAVASCSNYPAGFFTAYRDIAQHDELSAVVHLGDYIYEYAADGYASHSAAGMGRVSVPGHELISLEDYRLRHAQYKSDPDSIAMHAAHPLIAIWDDHEVANDAWLGGAENHQPEEGDWRERRRVAWQAYDEWMPTRSPDLAEHGRLFRSFDFGELASLILLDTRYFGRDQQLDVMALAADPEALERARRDESRELLGAAQAEWFREVLQQSAGRQRWQLIGQQVLVSELLLADLSAVLDVELARQRLGNERVDAILQLGGSGLPLLWDTWDGYGPARDRFLHSLDTLAANPVVLTGDIHTTVAGDLRLAGRSSNTAVELVTTSISSPGFDPYLPSREQGALADAFRTANPALHAFETAHRGWLRVDVTPERCSASWRYVERVDRPGAAMHTALTLETGLRDSSEFGLKRVG